jgi:fructose-bisphosphate aldolase class II
MLVNTIKILNKARNEGYAVPQFNINNLEWTRYILEACEEEKSPVILGVSEGAIKYMGGYKTVYNIVTGLISDLGVTIPIVLHLDHGQDINSCRLAIENGFTSVMIDASSKPLEENIDITKEVVIFAHGRNISVEGEIGHIGVFTDDTSEEVAYADVKDCKKLVNETLIDSLAPALGNVHGKYKGKAHINIDRLQEIKANIIKPLVLHGGTGIPDDQIASAIKNGVCKININTELQVVWTKAVREYLSKDSDVYDPRKVISSGEKAIKDMVKEKIRLFQSENKAF